MNKGQSIQFNHSLESESFQALTDKLRELAGDKAGTYIARALNKTAVSARQRLAAEAKLQYTVKSRGFKSDMNLKRAAADRLVAEINSEGAPLSMKEYKFSFSRPNPAKADIIKTGLKSVKKYGNKAFVGTGKANGHIYVRTGRKQSKNPERDAIEKLFSKSVPFMLGADRVFGEQRLMIEKDLKKFMNQQIQLLMKKNGGAGDAE